MTSFRKSVDEHNDWLSHFFFPFLCFCVFPCCWCRQQHSDDSLMTLIVMYFNNSLTIWNTEMNATDKEKNLSNRLMERARGSCKEESMIRKAAKSSKGVMHWTRQSNEMNNQNSSKMRRISVCLYWTLISHYWPLLIIIKKLLPNSVRANVLQDIHMQF